MNLGTLLALSCTAASSGRKQTSNTQLQKHTSYNYKELSSDALNLKASAPYPNQSEHPSALEQFGSIFMQQQKKKPKPVKEERSSEAAGIFMESWQASLPPLHAAGSSGVPLRAQTLHGSAVSLHETLTTHAASSVTSHFRRCQLQFHRSYQFCLRCFGLGS